MSLIIPKKQSTGVTLNYWKLAHTNCNWMNGTVTGLVFGWLNQDDMVAGMEAVTSRKIVVILPPGFHGDVRDFFYTHIKDMPEWHGALDDMTKAKAPVPVVAAPVKTPEPPRKSLAVKPVATPAAVPVDPVVSTEHPGRGYSSEPQVAITPVSTGPLAQPVWPEHTDDLAFAQRHSPVPVKPVEITPLPPIDAAPVRSELPTPEPPVKVVPLTLMESLSAPKKQVEVSPVIVHKKEVTAEPTKVDAVVEPTAKQKSAWATMQSWIKRKK